MSRRLPLLILVLLMGVIHGSSGFAAAFTVSFEDDHNDLPDEQVGSFRAGPFFDSVEQNDATDGTYSAVGQDDYTPVDGVQRVTKRARYAMGKCRNVGEVYTFSGDFAWAATSSPQALAEVNLRLVIAQADGTVRTSSGLLPFTMGQNVYATQSIIHSTTKEDVGEEMEFWIEWIDDNDVAGPVAIRADNLRFDVSGRRPLWGAIYWDGYNGSDRSTQIQEIGYRECGYGGHNPGCCEKPGPRICDFLKPPEHNWRIPFYATLREDALYPIELNPDYGSGDVSTAGPSGAFIHRKVIDEVGYARDAGIDFWAALHEAPEYPLNLRDSLVAIADQWVPGNPQFCSIANGTTVAPDWKPPSPIGMKKEDIEVRGRAAWNLNVADYVEFMKKPGYLKVMNSRPLIFIFDPTKLSVDLGDDPQVSGQVVPIPNYKSAIQHLRAVAIAAGLQNPYIVSMGVSALYAAVFVDEAGADAFSSYRPAPAPATGTPPFSYADLWSSIDAEILSHPQVGGAWSRKVIANMPSNLDASPRTEAGIGGEHGNYAEPMENEGYDLFKNVLDRTAQNPNDKYDTNTIITYAWNEFSEGGFLCPVVGRDRTTYVPGVDLPDTSILDKYSAAVHSWVSPQLEAQHLVAHLPLDGNTSDATGHGHHGSGLGVDDFLEEAVIGTHLAALNDEEGEYGQFIEIPDDPALEGMSGLTVSAWVRLDRLPDSTRHFAPVAKDLSYRLIVASDGSGHFAVSTASHGWYQAGTVASFPIGTIGANEWHHLAGTYDGERVEVWVDGRKRGEGSAAISGAISSSASWVEIGRASGQNVDEMNGQIDDVKIYDAAVYAAGIPACSNGHDDDGDGLVDLADSGCANARDADEYDPTLPCDNGLDDDHDGRTDYDPVTVADATGRAGTGDVGCRSRTSLVEDPKCQNGVNDDSAAGTDFDGGESVRGIGNGDSAGPDPQCAGHPERNSEMPNSNSCGLGFEVVGFMLPLVVWRHRQNRSRRGSTRRSTDGGSERRVC